MIQKILSLSPDSLGSLAARLKCDQKSLIDVALNVKHHYFRKSEETKPGKIRTFYIPDKKLTDLQKRIKQFLLNSIPISSSIHGYCKKRPNVTNAKCHVGKRIVAKFDIKNFFPSVHSTRIFKLFHSFGYSYNESRILTKLTTADHHLPHGFVTSPTISTLIIKNLEKRLRKFFRFFDLDYSFFSDDIAVSGNCDVRKLENLSCRIFQQEGFEINTDKIRYQYYYDRQEVTGLVVNKKENLKRESKEKLKAIINNCTNFGPSTQIDRFWQAYGPSRRGNRSILKFKERVSGLISNVKSVNPELYRKLSAGYNKIKWDN